MENVVAKRDHRLHKCLRMLQILTEMFTESSANQLQLSYEMQKGKAIYKSLEPTHRLEMFIEHWKS